MYEKKKKKKYSSLSTKETEICCVCLFMKDKTLIPNAGKCHRCLK